MIMITQGKGQVMRVQNSGFVIHCVLPSPEDEYLFFRRYVKVPMTKDGYLARYTSPLQDKNHSPEYQIHKY